VKYKIEKGVPLPSMGRRCIYPLAEMVGGDSFQDMELFGRSKRA